MKKKKSFTLIIFALILLSILVVSGFIVFGLCLMEKEDNFIAPIAGDAKDIKFTIFTQNDYWDEIDVKSNAAILITDKKEMKEAQELFLAKQQYAHVCGYHYSISFWYDIDSLYCLGSFNKDCESFDYRTKEAHKRLNQYAKQLETNPTHYIYNLSIPVFIPPDKVKEKLSDSGLMICFLDGKMNHYPKAHIEYETKSFVEKKERYSKEAEEKDARKFREKIGYIVNNVNVVVPIINKSEIYFSGIGTINDSTYHKGSIDLTFELEVDTLKITRILEQAGVKVDFLIPKMYKIQLLDPSPNLNDIRNKLKKYVFIEQISEYGDN